MFYSSIYFFPSLVCLVWLTIYLFRRKNTSQKVLTTLLFLEILHSASQAFYVSPETNYRSMCYWDIISQPLILCTVAVASIYSHVQYKGKIMSAWSLELFFVPALVQAIAVWLLYSLIGIDNVARFVEASDKAYVMHPGMPLFDALPKEFDTKLYHLFHLFDGIIFDGWCLFLGTGLVILCARTAIKYGHVGDGVRFWLKGGSTTPQCATSYWLIAVMLIYLARVVVGRTYLYTNPTMAICMALYLSVCIFFMCYCEYFSHLPNYTLYNLTHADILVCEEMVMVNAEKEDELTAEDEEQSALQTEQLEESVEVDNLNSDLAVSLKRELEIKKAFMDSSLSLESLAKQLGTNRSKLSGVVSQVYNMDFRNAIARMRIEEAKAFMLQNPTATTETIAMHCGFKDPSAFFHRFKDFTNETPRMWIMKNKENNKL